MWQIASVQGHQRSEHLERSQNRSIDKEEKEKYLKNVLLNGNKLSLNLRIINKTHPLDVETVQLLIGRLFLRSGLVLQLVASDAD